MSEQKVKEITKPLCALGQGFSSAVATRSRLSFRAKEKSSRPPWFEAPDGTAYLVGYFTTRRISHS